MADQQQKAEPYRFAPKFQQAVLRHLVFDRGFWARVGATVEPDAFAGDAARLVALAAKAVGAETGKGPGSGTIVVQRVSRWRHEGRVTHEQVVAVGDLVDELEDMDDPPDPDGVGDELIPVIKERRNREAVRLAMRRVGSREGDLEDVIEHLQATVRLGASQIVAGTQLGPKALDAIRRLRRTDKLPTGISELDCELSGGPPVGTLSVVMGGAGDGKCHAAGQEILMADGSVKLVEDVRVWDRLMAPEGKVRNVLATSRGEGEMYEVRPLRGEPWRVNADHILTLVGTGRPGVARYGGRVVDVSVRDYLSWPVRRRRDFKLWRAPVDEIPVRVRRKEVRPRRQRKNVLLTGFDVVPTGIREPYFGFTLDGDGRYLLGDFTVTHNSMFLCHVTGSALLSGRNVLVATLELNEEQWLTRLIANLTGVPIDGIADGSMESEALMRLESLPPRGSCFVGQFAPEVTTVSDLITWVDAVEQREGIGVDALVVDYADLLGHSKSRDYEGMREVYGGLREEFAVKRSGWSWTASQSRRRSKSTEKQGADDAADSQHKIRVADLWIALNASDDEVEYRIAKNRGGKRGGVVSLPTEFECARIAPVAESAEDGQADLF